MKEKSDGAYGVAGESSAVLMENNAAKERRWKGPPARCVLGTSDAIVSRLVMAFWSPYRRTKAVENVLSVLFYGLYNKILITVCTHVALSFPMRSFVPPHQSERPRNDAVFRTVGRTRKRWSDGSGNLTSNLGGPF